MSFKPRVGEPGLLDLPHRATCIPLFARRLSEVLAAAAIPLDGSLARAQLGDSRRLHEVLTAKYTHVVTSPPYPNRMSYIRELRPYMYWLGYLNDGRQAGELDWRAIGGTWGCATSNLARWKPDPVITEVLSSVAPLPSPGRGRHHERRFQDLVAGIADAQPDSRKIRPQVFRGLRQPPSFPGPLSWTAAPRFTTSSAIPSSTMCSCPPSSSTPGCRSSTAFAL